MIELPKKISILGMGYVGTPLAIEFSKNIEVVGFDLDIERIDGLNRGFDRSNDLSKEQLASSRHIKFSHSEGDIAGSDCFIVTVPTPVNDENQPNFDPLRKASEMVGRNLSENSIVIYESTVYPGATEEICVPILEKVSSLKFNKQFFCGYSPERINPGDKENTLRNIKKITSGSTDEVANIVDELYKTIIDAGTFKASSIRVAEAAKVIENAQRDINIAFVNELSKIFSKLSIDTNEVLEAAETKWNFLPFKPGLVGGHCIGVDPYYLSYKSEQVGYYPEIILSGRRINDSMSDFVFSEVLNLMKTKGTLVKPNSKILILGSSFKENCSDIRNSKVFDLVRHFEDSDFLVDVYDPNTNLSEVEQVFGKQCLQDMPQSPSYSAVVLAVAHDEFLDKSLNLRDLLINKGVIYDIKGKLPLSMIDARL
jgi:UDP-N-acetyl-D-galactosamine dehydrogenase